MHRLPKKYCLLSVPSPCNNRLEGIFVPYTYLDELFAYCRRLTE